MKEYQSDLMQESECLHNKCEDLRTKLNNHRKEIGCEDSYSDLLNELNTAMTAVESFAELLGDIE